jgi:hypothetical protein
MTPLNRDLMKPQGIEMSHVYETKQPKSGYFQY